MFEQVTLPYALDALEPYIDTLTMETHYGKHHKTYTANFNAAVEKVPSLQGKSVVEILSNLDAVPESERTAIRNNGGGYYNHNLYFEQLSPTPGKPSGALLDKINQDFVNLDTLIEQLTQKAVGQFGSGWGWLVVNKDGKLEVINTPNQDTPYMMGYKKILIALDVWEHAYYLKYKNLRPDYIKSFYEVLNWDVVAKRFAE